MAQIVDIEVLTANLSSYYDRLANMLDSGQMNFCTNTDRAHNAMVMKFFLDHATTDINMYCGSMSIFKQSFYTEIAKSNGSEYSETIKCQVIDGLKHFMSHDNVTLNIIVEDLKGDSYIDSCIKDYIDTGRIVLRTFPEDFMFKGKIEHFTVTSSPELYRLEIDKDRHEAICAINAKELTDSGLECFEGLWGMAKDYIA